jgi:hypothetical protein
MPLGPVKIKHILATGHQTQGTLVLFPQSGDGNRDLETLERIYPHFSLQSTFVVTADFPVIQIFLIFLKFSS